MSEESRIKESLSIESDYRAKAVRTRAERRERIATAVLVPIYEKYYDFANARGFESDWKEGISRDACDLADTLIAELDRRLATELQEGS